LLEHFADLDSLRSLCLLEHFADLDSLRSFRLPENFADLASLRSFRLLENFADLASLRSFTRVYACRFPDLHALAVQTLQLVAIEPLALSV